MINIKIFPSIFRSFLTFSKLSDDLSLQNFSSGDKALDLDVAFNFEDVVEVDGEGDDGDGDAVNGVEVVEEGGLPPCGKMRYVVASWDESWFKDGGVSRVLSRQKGDP